MKLAPVLIFLVLAGAVAGYYFFVAQKEIPDIVLQDAAGQRVTLDTIRGERDNVLLVFFLHGCPLSQYSLGMVKQLYPQYSNRIAFAGLFFGTQDLAEKFRADNAIQFPVYGIRSTQDPFAMNELYEEIGVSHGTRSAIYGGTVVVVDDARLVKFKLEKDEVRELPDKLASLVD